jgi:gamma-glutamyltranspeptidase/glutathione hydrolase
MLQMITPYSPADLGRGSSATIHLMSEVMKRAYADRATYLGDPSHVTIPAASLVSRGYAEALMRGYSPERATPAAEAGPGDPFRFESDSTTHFSIADSHGNVVAVTTTLNSWFGMGAVLDGYGFLLNNEMDDFSASPGAPNMYGLVGAEANAVAPGKRMLSSMTPAIIAKEGKPFMVLGSPGGGRITTMVFQVILNVIDHGMELQEALGAPRCHHQWRPDRITCEEEALIRDVREGLERRGHEVRAGRAWGNVQALLFDPVSGLIHGASDPRGYGEPLGY